jgi:hypothetical protein
MRFEFRVIALKGAAKDEEACLNLYGLAGWELAAVIPYPYERIAYLQRRVPEQ